MSQNHLVTMGTEGWTLWKWFQLRSAGFPADGAIALGNAEVETLLDTLFETHKNCTELHDRIAARLGELAQGDDVLANDVLANDAERNQHRLRKGKALTPIGDEQFDRDLEEYNRVKPRLAAEEEAAIAAIEAERPRSSGVLRTFAEDPLFREAIAWQNHGILGAAIASFLRSEPTASNAKARDRQRLLTKYIQRYTLKNDTIGFFGPTAWGQFDPECAGFDLERGPLIARRETFFEYWMIGALVEQLNQLPEMLPICSLRLRLGSRVADRAFLSRDGSTQELSELQSAILSLAGTTNTIAEIVALVAEQSAGASNAELYEEVGELVRLQFATAKIEVPTEITHPETWLRDLLTELPGSEARDTNLATLARLETHRATISGAAGDVDALCSAIGGLEEEFREATGGYAKRGHGQVYAGRQIFYEECVRGGNLTAGRSFIDSLASPLGLVLQSARWFTYHIGRKYRAAFTAVYKELKAQNPGAAVPLMSFQIASLKHFKDETRDASDIISAVQRELRRRWEQVLQIDASSSSAISLRSEDCAARVAELFAAPGPGWPSARYQSPDIMLVAPSAEEVAKGNFEAVLGELHCGTNTLLAMTPFSLHPEKEAMAQACSEDLQEPVIASVESIANRVATPSVAPDTIALEDKVARSWRPRKQVLVGGDLFVEERGGALVVVSHSTGEHYDIIRFLDFQLSPAAVSHFSVLPRKPHMPRVTIDSLIISRERWSYKRPEFAALIGGKGTPSERFAALGKWVRERELPRFVFAVVPNEPKPIYVDFASLSLVEVLLLFLAKASSLSITEALPGHGQHWLECDQGEHYASELRVVAVDPIAWTSEL